MIFQESLFSTIGIAARIRHQNVSNPLTLLSPSSVTMNHLNSIIQCYHRVIRALKVDAHIRRTVTYNSEAVAFQMYRMAAAVNFHRKRMLVITDYQLDKEWRHSFGALE